MCFVSKYEVGRSRIILKRQKWKDGTVLGIRLKYEKLEMEWNEW